MDTENHTLPVKGKNVTYFFAARLMKLGATTFIILSALHSVPPSHWTPGYKHVLKPYKLHGLTFNRYIADIYW
jgi:hypothetical protein